MSSSHDRRRRHACLVTGYAAAGGAWGGPSDSSRASRKLYKGCHKPYLDEAGEQQHGVQDQAQELARPPGAQPQVGVQQHRQPKDEERLLQRLQAAEAVSAPPAEALPSPLCLNSLQQHLPVRGTPEPVQATWHACQDTSRVCCNRRRLSHRLLFLPALQPSLRQDLLAAMHQLCGSWRVRVPA